MSPRRPLFFALLAALCAASIGAGDVAEPASKPVRDGKDVKIDGCDNAEQAASLAGWIEEARDLVDTCLSGVNPAFAKKINARFKTFAFHCGSWPGAGGKTVHGKGKVDITYNFGAGSPYPERVRVYHEVLHAADREEKYIFSAATHDSSAGYPDVIYGCQFACDSTGMNEQESGWIGRYLAALESEGRQPKKDPDFGCDAKGLCTTEGVYRGLCKKNAPDLPRAWTDQAHASERPKCLTGLLLNACVPGKTAKESAAKCATAKIQKSALCRLRCEYDGAGEDGNKISAVASKASASAANLARAFDKDGEGLEGDDAHYYHELKLTKKLERCR